MLKLFNNLTKTKDVFAPINPHLVRMYVCGPTVYDYAHLGNARSVIVFDMLYRWLKHQFPKVVYVRNFTDIDDKIMNRAKQDNVSIQEITDKYIAIFHEDMEALGALRPDHEPRATEYVPGMIAMIQGLIDKEFAYVVEGHVLYRVKAFASYGQHICNLPQDQLEAGARVDVAPYKESASDFVLWKPSSDAQPGWESPWGRGRPGWHIECSVMSSALLGNTFDVHGGGMDLMFPHHENEIAQSCAFHGVAEIAQFWVHNGFLTIDKEKMSKSLGNFITAHALLERYPGEVIRYAFLMTHYRQPMDFSDETLQLAKNNLDRVYAALKHPTEDLIYDEFIEAMNDDLNTPLALSLVMQLVHQFNKDNDTTHLAKIRYAGAALCLFQGDPVTWFQGEAVDAIDDWIQKREQARLAKDYGESDRIRSLLEDRGVILEDTASGTHWRRK